MSDPTLNRVVLVTGGTRGIGRSLATAFFNEGARVAIGARDPEQLKKVSSVVSARRARLAEGSRRGELMPLRLDVRMPRAVAFVVSRVVEAWGRLDVLVNAAPVLFEEHLQMIRGCLPHMVKGGRILTLVRASGSAAAGALSRPSLDLGEEIAHRGITFNAILTGGAVPGREDLIVARALEWTSPEAASITGRIYDVGADAGS